jgi:16S rRNA (adenine1518-N6/adenine1519-N6)-dimethyltransferase
MPSSQPTSPRQTQSFLMRRFEEAGLRPETRRGQNFLIDLNLLDLLVRTAEVGPGDVVLEVGTGLGSLTTRLAEKAAAVVTVEIDTRLFQLASEELAQATNVTLLQQDALHSKNTLSPVILDAVREKLSQIPGSQFKLAANLPYNVATPILSNLLAADRVPVSMTATIQKELADRIAALPGTKDYSALSIWIQALADVEIVRVMPPQVFWPRPKVQSAIVHIVTRPAKRARLQDVAFFHQFVRALFFHRRKLLRVVLAGMLREHLDKPAIDALLAEHDVETSARAEELPGEKLIELAAAVCSRCGRDCLRP